MIITSSARQLSRVLFLMISSCSIHILFSWQSSTVFQVRNKMKNEYMCSISETAATLSLYNVNRKNYCASLVLLSSESDTQQEVEDDSQIESKSPALRLNDKNVLLEELNQSFSYEGRMNQQQKQQQQDFRFGYVSLVGAPNMGKSTLLNALIGEDLCVATRRPQTTRHAILGILSEPNVQLAFMDTPGIIENPSYMLQEGMMEAVKGALNDADVILLVTDIFSTPIPDDKLFAKIQHLSFTGAKSVIVAVNKVDMLANFLAKRKKWEQMQENKQLAAIENKTLPAPPVSVLELEDEDDDHDHDNDNDNDNDTSKTYSIEDAVWRWRTLLPNAIAIIPLTATDKDNMGVHCLRTVLCGVSDVPESIRKLGRPIPGMFQENVKFISNNDARALIPTGPPLYEFDTLTDRNERFFASEMIRAAIFEEFKKEIPYCTEVQITEFKEPEDGIKNPIIRMSATIFVERESQKGIVVGTGGKQIKKVGIRARKSLEEFFQSKVHLELRVKVDKDWRSKEDALKKFGYIK